jgi:hypothetical protein
MLESIRFGAEKTKSIRNMGCPYISWAFPFFLLVLLDELLEVLLASTHKLSNLRSILVELESRHGGHT